MAGHALWEVDRAPPRGDRRCENLWLGMRDHPLSQPLGLVLEALEQNLADKQVAQQHLRLVERAEGSTEA